MGSGASKTLLLQSSDQQFESLIPGQQSSIITDINNNNNISNNITNINNKRNKKNEKDDAISNHSVENLISITEGSSHTINPGLISINEEYQNDLLLINRMSSFDRSPGKNPLDTFNFLQTEGQIRRENMADCEFECSKITKYLFVGGYHVAGNWDVLKENNIKRIVNCSSGIVENRFIHDKDMKYLSLNMYDGRQDDISWFFCEVIQFIVKGRSLGENTLIHCEKGVSRSCSFAIVYRMWSTGCQWKEAFDYVKERRKVCAPNTAFTCNIIEIGELLSNDLSTCNLIFRCSYHLPHDLITPLLKICRNNESRKLAEPCTSMLNPKGVFLIRAITVVDNNHISVVGKSNRESVLYLWGGNLSTDDTVMKAEELAKHFFGIITRAENVIKVRQGEEPAEFLQFLIDDGPYDEEKTVDVYKYVDYYDCRPNLEDDSVIDENNGIPLLKSDSYVVVNVNDKMKRRDSDKASIDLPLLSELEFNRNKSKVSIVALPKLFDNSDSIPINVTFSAPNTERSGDNTLNIQALSARRPESNKANEHTVSPRLRKTDLNLQLAINKHNPEIVASSISSITTPSQLNELEKVPQIRPTSSKSKLVPAVNISKVPSNSRLNTNSTEDHVEDRNLESSPSQNNLGIAVNNSMQRPPSSERRGTFKSPRMVPIIADTQMTKIIIDAPIIKGDAKSVSDTLTTTPTDTTHSRVPSPAIFNSDSQDINKDTIQQLKLTSQFSKKTTAPVSLPLKLVGGRTTPTTDKHPDHIGLSRGPTPVEDLTPGGTKIRRDHQYASSRGTTPVDDSIPPSSSRINNMDDIHSHRKPKPLSLTKPSLFQAVPNSGSSSSSVPFEWQAMGVYDDEDLNETSIFLLLSPSHSHFLWLGRDINQQEYGIEKDNLNGKMLIHQWASKVQNGEVKFEHMVGSYLNLNNLSIQRSGEENELFWSVFNEGF